MNTLNRFFKYKPAPAIDLSLAEVGELEDGETYLARILGAKFINSAFEDRTPKLDICLQLIDPENNQLGVINTYLWVSARAMKRLKSFLLATEVVTTRTLSNPPTKYRA